MPQGQVDSLPGYGQTAMWSGRFALSLGAGNDTLTTLSTRGIFLGTAGDLKVDMSGSGTPITFSNLAAGICHPICASRVYATGTTATGIIVVW